MQAPSLSNRASPLAKLGGDEPGNSVPRTHEPILEPLERLIRRGQDSGDFDRKLPVDWMLAAMFGLGGIASQEISAGRMNPQEATHALQYSVLRIFGVDDPPID